MPETVDAVVKERPSKEALNSDLDSHGPSSHSSHHALRLKVPSGVRGSEVGEAEEVEGSGEDNGGHTIQGRAVPCDLRLVDGEMRGDGAVEALFGEDLDGFGFGGCESIFFISIDIHVDSGPVDAGPAVRSAHTSAGPSRDPQAEPSIPAPQPVANQAGRVASKTCWLNCLSPTRVVEWVVVVVEFPSMSSSFPRRSSAHSPEAAVGQSQPTHTQAEQLSHARAHPIFSRFSARAFLPSFTNLDIAGTERKR
jgi:hypothetical protein